jgi:hypothetical protein
MYATLGCGATRFHAGSLVDLPRSELERRVAWARGVAEDVGFRSGAFDETVKLHGNKLSAQFERAIAFARSYSPEALDESRLWADLQELCVLLVRIYERERQGKDPTIDPAEAVNTGQDEVDRAIRPRQSSRGGQGRGLSHPERVAVELRAMDVCRAGLLAMGYGDIKDVSATKPYDFTASKEGEIWFIEVKGTTSPSGEAFLLTATELALHIENAGKTILAIVSAIELNRTPAVPTATAGSLDLMIPWNSKEWDFEPIAFRAKRRA